MDDQQVDPANAGPREGYAEVLHGIRAAGRCPFCIDNLPNTHPRPILWQSDHWIVTENAWPYEGTKQHFLLISVEHVERIEELSPEAGHGFFEAYAWLAEHVGFPGATILWRSGGTDQTGASVSHLHAQVVVGYPRSGDSEKMKIFGVVGFKESE